MVLKVGIISANWGAYAHLPAWRAIEGVEVTAICTSRQETAEAAAAATSIPRAFWDAEAMAADPDIDIIDVGTRPNLRHAMVLAALRNGKPRSLRSPDRRSCCASASRTARWLSAALPHGARNMARSCRRAADGGSPRR